MAGRDPAGWLDVVRHDLIPVASAFVVFVALLVAYHRARRGGRGTLPRVRGGVRAPDPGWPQLIRYLAGIMAGGFLFFLAIVVVFYFVLGDEDVSLIIEALLGGSALAFLIAGPAFLVLSWLAEHGRANRQQRTARPRGHP